MQLFDREHQILATHAEFIRQVVQFSQNAAMRPQLQQILQSAKESGWSALVVALEQILKGERNMNQLRGLDEEDQVIAEAVMRGLQDPSTLPETGQQASPSMAGPGLAHMIQAAASNPQALILVGQMAEQMSKAGGDMARLAGVIRPMINGERDENKLSRGMGEQGRKLLRDILEVLNEEKFIL